MFKGTARFVESLILRCVVWPRPTGLGIGSSRGRANTVSSCRAVRQGKNASCYEIPTPVNCARSFSNRHPANNILKKSQWSWVYWLTSQCSYQSFVGPIRFQISRRPVIF